MAAGGLKLVPRLRRRGAAGGLPSGVRERLFSLAASRWVRALAVVLAGWIAQAGCLHAVTWYLDDSWQVHDSEFVEGGLWWKEPGLLLTNLSYYLTWRVAGFSTVAFHLGNLCIHLALALSVYWLGRHLFSLCDRSDPAAWEGPSWIAAVLFAVHPLTTEVTHYIRARDHGLVALFSFLAAGFTALAIRGNIRWSFAAFCAVTLAAFSKGPGLPHALLSVALVMAAAVPAETSWRSLMPRGKFWIPPALTALAFGALFWPQIVLLKYLLFRELFRPRFYLHALTQARVLPQYLWRMAIPVHLCSDHLVAWTKNFTDVAAWLWLAAALGMIAVIAVLWQRRVQPWALLLALALSALLLRWLYVVSELMVEYRTYPAMPWVAMLFALAIWRLRERWPIPAGAAFAAVLCVFTLLCRERSRDWQSSAAIHAQILHLYPLQLRAFNGLSTDDLREGRYQAIIGRQPDFLHRLQIVLGLNRTDPHRYLENWPLWAVCEDSMFGEAIAHLHGTYSAMDQLNLTAWRMNQNHMDHPGLWAVWRYSVANVLLLRGDKVQALRDYRLARPFLPAKLLVDRKIEEILSGAEH